jgi:hypothetical protein
MFLFTNNQTLLLSLRIPLPNRLDPSRFSLLIWRGSGTVHITNQLVCDVRAFYVGEVVTNQLVCDVQCSMSPVL